MIILPLPFIRSIGIGGMLIPAVSVLAAITLLPALLAVLGTRINSLRVLPKRFLDQGHPEDGPWGRWATLRDAPAGPGGDRRHRHRRACCSASALQLNPSEAQAKDLPGTGDAIGGRAALADAGISAGVMKPFVVLVHGSDVAAIEAKVAAVPGVVGVSAPKQWRKDGYALVQAIPSADGASKPVRTTIDRTKAALVGTDATLGGVAPEDRDFVHAVYNNFPYVLGFVILLTYLLLARAFRSLVLPLKAVMLNLVSLGAAYGIIVFIFQQGHGSEAIWNVHATQSIIPWIPLMIFAFLFGLSMDYEVFMLTRMREAYDESGDTNVGGRARARADRQARHERRTDPDVRVLRARPSSPGVDIKQFGIGLAAGIIFDATVIRALLVPALMRLLGEWNWWLPKRAAKVLLVSEPV